MVPLRSLYVRETRLHPSELQGCCEHFRMGQTRVTHPVEHMGT